MEAGEPERRDGRSSALQAIFQKAISEARETGVK